MRRCRRGFGLILCVLWFIFVYADNHGDQLSNKTLAALTRPGHQHFDLYHGNILAPLLIPRTPGSDGHAQVQAHIVNFLRRELPQWTIELHNISYASPLKPPPEEIIFTNIIATRDPPWTATASRVERLVIAAHYESKLEPAGFVGAIDAAAPCAMMLHAAQDIDAAVTAKWASMQDEGDAGLDVDRGIQLVFFDGEEALVTWTAEDSLYGSRALAESWAAKSQLDQIELLMLLDLLGSADPHVSSHDAGTHWAYEKLHRYEARLRALDLLRSRPSRGTFLADDVDFRPRQSHILDDHRPFADKGVPCLLVMDTPPAAGFPAVWHRAEDDGEHLDMPTVEDWAVLVAAFMADYLHLEGYVMPERVGEAPLLHGDEL